MGTSSCREIHLSSAFNFGPQEENQNVKAHDYHVDHLKVKAHEQHVGHLKPGGVITTIHFGEYLTNDELQAIALLKRRPGFDRKVKEMLGNELFKDPYPAPGDCSGAGSSITGHCPKMAGKISRFTLSGPVCTDRKCPNTPSGWAKQKELYGTMEDDTDITTSRSKFPQVSKSKRKELAGHDFSGTPPVESPKPLQQLDKCEVEYGGVTKDHADLKANAIKVHKQKFQTLEGHNILFRDEACPKPLMSVETPTKPSHVVSKAKMQELLGNGPIIPPLPAQIPIDTKLRKASDGHTYHGQQLPCHH
ncbi:unnamed protein product [Sphagnum jensenii]|uniref:DUF4057 domain-containing protein n=1 Tax=Sphagnum jensenii TaxID=128206 RepID=A0ABP1BBX7_9BRYO